MDSAVWSLPLIRSLALQKLILILFSFVPPLDDAVFIEGEPAKREYVLNDVGKIYIGSYSKPKGRKWIYGQVSERHFRTLNLFVLWPPWWSFFQRISLQTTLASMESVQIENFNRKFSSKWSAGQTWCFLRINKHTLWSGISRCFHKRLTMFKMV